MESEQAYQERQEKQIGRLTHSNVSGIERGVSVAAGGALAAFGANRRGVVAPLLIATGSVIALRGLFGWCPVYAMLGRNTASRRAGAAASVLHKQGVRVEREVTIQRPAEELYRYWRNLENLPQFMDHLESVDITGDGRSHWRAKAPAGRHAEWDAEIIEERPNEWIAWRSLDGSSLGHAGSVHFEAAPGGRGTEVKVELEYVPPAGRLGTAVAKLFGQEPDVQVREDLRRFKEMMEAGEVATTHGQPSGRNAHPAHSSVVAT